MRAPSMTDPNQIVLQNKDRRASNMPNALGGWLWVEVTLLLLGGWAYWPALREILQTWNSNPDYSHGFLVVPIALVFLWVGRHRRPDPQQGVCWLGLALLAAAGGLRYAAGRFYLPELDGWSIPVWLGGIVLLFHGRRFFVWALPALGFLWFATPLPGSIEILLSTPLQHLAAVVSSWILQLFGQPAIAEGTTILLDQHVLDIERACSGLRMFYGIFALAVAWMVLARLRGWTALVVLVAAVPVALSANILRIFATGLLLQSVSDEAAARFSHDFAGYLMIPLGVVMFALLLLCLQKAKQRYRANPAAAMSNLLQWGVGSTMLVGVLLWWGNTQSRQALDALLESATRYETAHDWHQALNHLQRYLQANPENDAVRERFAVAFSKTASSEQEKKRVVTLCYKAWQKNPDRKDLALSAAQLALQLDEYHKALQIADELLAATNDESQRHELTLLRADTLLHALELDDSSDRYSWEALASALEAAQSVPQSGIRYGVELARVWQDKLSSPDQAQRTARAFEILNQLVSKHADNPLAWLARHQFAVEFAASDNQEARQLARQDLQQAIELVDRVDGAQQWVLYLAAAGQSQQDGDTDAAIKYFQQAIAASPSEPRPYIALAELKRLSSNPNTRQEAIELLKSALDRVGQQQSRLLLPLASLYVEAEDWAAAQASLEQVEATLGEFDDRNRSKLKLGVALVRTNVTWRQQGAYPAIQFLEAVVSDEAVQVHRHLSPELFAQAHLLLGHLYRWVDIRDRASQQYRLALQLNPEAQTAKIEAADSALLAGDLESAELYCRQVLKATPTSREALLSMIRIQIRRQLRQPPDARDWSKAEIAYTKAESRGVSHADLLLVEVELRKAQGKFYAAEQLLLKAVEQSPRDAPLWRELAVLLDHGGQLDRALGAVDKFLECAPAEIEPYVLKAILLEKSNHSQQAQQLLSDLLDRCTAEQWVVAAQELASLQLLVGKIDEATVLLEAVRQQQPENLSVLSTLADLAWVATDWPTHQQCESWLQDVEGSTGSLWRFHRARRLLETAATADDPRFEDVLRISQTLQKIRPRWSKTSLLRGDIALRAGQIEVAIAAFQQAWNLGDRSALLADRLIELLTGQGRLSEARSYVLQVRGALALSSRLFDRAMPHYVEAIQQARALTLAEAWVERQPNDAAAHLRLGRVLWLLGDEEEANFSQRAEAAFRQALHLAPKDVSVWVANVMFAQQHNDSAELSLILQRLSQQLDLDEFSMALVLAQVNEALDRPGQAQSYYRRAMQLAAELEQPDGAAEALGRAAQFYLLRVPILAEQLARRALSVTPDAALPRQVLIEALVGSDRQAAWEEALAMLSSEPKNQLEVRGDQQRRWEARLLAQLNEPQQRIEAIGLLETLLQKTHDDKLLLASLYEQQGRLGPAFELLSELANQSAPRTRDFVAFLQFWQRNFLSPADSDERPQFYALANQVYDQLRKSPLQQAVWLRWKLREQKQSRDPDQLTWPDAKPLLAELLHRNENFANWSDKARLAWQRSVLEVMLKEELPECAVAWMKSLPSGVSKVEAAIAFCHAMILVPVTAEFQIAANNFLRGVQARYANRADLLRAIGDYQLMTGQYQLATDAYRRALSLEPDHTLTSNNLALALAEQPGQLTAARAVIEGALAEQENDPVLLDTLAVIELIDQRERDALRLLKQVLASTPDNAAAHLHAAMGFRALGERIPMLSAYVEALGLGVDPALLSPRDRAFCQEMGRQNLAELPFEVLRGQDNFITTDEPSMVLAR